METLQWLLHFILHIDTQLVAFVSSYGIITYVILFMIIFCETGLVIFPFLPGDSLLFASGSLAAQSGQPLKIQLLLVMLLLASILGNKLNYLLGRLLGPRIFSRPNTWLLNKRHLQEAHQFYEKHGGKAIIMARFLPVIRSFAPFVAGMGRMNIMQFSFYNVLSAIIWVGTLLYAGYFFGNLPFVKNNFTWFIYGIIAISLLPALIAFVYRYCISRSN